MRSKIFKPIVLGAVILFSAYIPVFAQVSPPEPAAPAQPVEVVTPNVTVDIAPVVTPDVVVNVAPVVVNTDINVDTDTRVNAKVRNKSLKVKLHSLTTTLKNLDVKTTAQVNVALSNLNVQLKELGPQISEGFKDLDDNISYSNEKQDNASEKVKNFSKSYSADNNKLSIDNRYGRVTVLTWDKNEFKVDVQIKADANSDEDAQKMLDHVTINDMKEGDNVLFKTEIGSESGSWMSWVSGKHSAHKLEINYTVYMPAKSDLNVDNRYGATELPNLSGKLTINSAYGSLSAKSLSNNDNIQVKYGSASIESLGNCSLEVAYGSLDLGSADKLSANISYSGVKIGKLHTSGSINLRYTGGFKIEDIDRNMRNLDITASYSSVDLGLSGDENANFDVTTRYGGFNYNGNVTITSKTPSDDEHGVHFTKNYKGYLGKGNSEKTITINSTYGSVNF